MGLSHRVFTLVLPLIALGALLAACDDGRRIARINASEPREDGTRAYRIELSEGPGVRAEAFEHTGDATDDWVHHCFEPAEVGGQLPFYCSAGRTVTEVILATIAALASVGAVWLISPVVGWRVPPPEPVAAVRRDASLFQRAEAEKRSHRPVRREHWRMAVTGYAAKMAGAGLVAAVAVTFVAARVWSDSFGEWAVAAGAFNLVGFAALYLWWHVAPGHFDEVSHARVTLGMGIGIGLLLAGMVVAPPFESMGQAIPSPTPTPEV